MAKQLDRIQIERAAERIRQERETFDQLKEQDRKWFLLKLVMGFSSVLLLGIVLSVSTVILLNSNNYQSSVVISAGIKPRDELAKKIGLSVGPRGGILVNDSMQTSNPDIFAIGEVALHAGMIYGLVAPGYEMAEVLATNLLGGHKLFSAFDMSTKLKLIGVEVASFGDAFGVSEPCRTIVFEDKIKGVYKRINVSLDSKRLLGGILVGEAESYNGVIRAVNLQGLPETSDLR